MAYYHCSACGEPIPNRSGYCSRDQMEWRRKTVRPCSDGCGRPAEPYESRCTVCRSLYRKAHFARGNRICSCGARVPKGYSSHMCRDCRRIYSKSWRERKKEEKG